MNLNLLFRIFAVITAFNAVTFIFLTEAFLEMASIAVTPGTITLGQAMGTSLLFIGLLAWRTPDIAADAKGSYAQLFGIGSMLFVVLISYHVMTGQASGPPAYGNLVVNIVLAGLFFNYSRKS